MTTGFLVTRNMKTTKVRSSGIYTNSDDSSGLTFETNNTLERSGNSQQREHMLLYRRHNQPQVWCNREQHRWDALSHCELYKRGRLRLIQLSSLFLDHYCHCLRQHKSPYVTKGFASASCFECLLIQKENSLAENSKCGVVVYLVFLSIK